MAETDPATDILSKLRALLPTSEDTPDDEGDPRDVRGLKAELTRTRELKRKYHEGLTALKTQVEGLTATHAAELKRLKEETGAEVTRIKTGFDEELSVIRAGVNDPETLAETRSVWASLDPTTRPKTPGDFAKSLIEAAKDPKKATTIPKRLQGYYSAIQVQAEDPPDTEGKVKTGNPDKLATIKSAKTMQELFSAARDLQK